MPTIGSWFGEPALDDWRDNESLRAYETELLIKSRPTSITLVRSGVVQTAQTVRIERNAASATERRSETARADVMDVLIIGYLDHPIIADTDIQRGDRFLYNGQDYEVIQTDEHVGRLLVTAEAR